MADKTPTNHLVTEPDSWNHFAKAPSFAALNTGPCIPPIEAMLASISASHLPLGRATGVLDTGCGSGFCIANLIWKHGHEIPADAQLLATDFSRGMVESTRDVKAREIARGTDLRHVWQRLEVQVLDAQTLDTIPDHSLSHVLSNYVYFMLPDPRKALLATRRVLKKDAIFAQASWQGNEWMQLIETGVTSIDREMARLPAAWSSVEGVQAELEWAGFRNISVKPVETYMDFEDHEQFCETMIKIPATQNILEGCSEDELITVKLSMVRRLREWYPQPGRMKGTAIVSIATN